MCNQELTRYLTACLRSIFLSRLTALFLFSANSFTRKSISLSVYFRSLSIIPLTHSSAKLHSVRRRYFWSLAQSPFIISRGSSPGNARASTLLSPASTLPPPLYQYYKKNWEQMPYPKWRPPSKPKIHWRWQCRYIRDEFKIII